MFILGLTEDFRIGSVVLIVGSSLYAAGLAALWLWVRERQLAALTGLALATLGLFVLHVAEAAGLALVAAACVPLVMRARGGTPFPWRHAGLLAAVLGLVVLMLSGKLRRLFAIPGSGFRWDLQANSEDPVTAALVSLLQQPSGFVGVALVWLVVAIVGFWLSRRRKLSPVPLIAFCVPVVLGTLAGMSATPGWLNLLTAPWYGTAARTGLMAAAPVILGASLSMSALVMRSRDGHRVVGWLLAAAMIAAMAVQVVPSRRADLRSTLAGAGDTLQIARLLEERIEEGGAVLNLEGDGTANMFAYARVPVLDGLGPDPRLEMPWGGALTDSLLELDDPAVAERLDDLGVEYIALGTTSRYWGARTGYSWQQVASQPQVKLELVGTDLVVLRYVGGPS